MIPTAPIRKPSPRPRTEQLPDPDLPTFTLHGHIWEPRDADAFACPIGYQLAFERKLGTKETPS